LPDRRAAGTTDEFRLAASTAHARIDGTGAVLAAVRHA
jgi:hypothetical protein